MENLDSLLEDFERVYGRLDKILTEKFSDPRCHKTLILKSNRLDCMATALPEFTDDLRSEVAQLLLCMHWGVLPPMIETMEEEMRRDENKHRLVDFCQKIEALDTRIVDFLNTCGHIIYGMDSPKTIALCRPAFKLDSVCRKVIGRV